MPDSRIDQQDRELIEAARSVLRRNYLPSRHTVGAAVRAASGKIYVGVNVEACGYGPCAEPIAIGAAFSSGERKIVAMVAVRKRGEDYPLLSPCGNCRQLLVDYCPDAAVIHPDGDRIEKSSAASLLPRHYSSNFGSD